MTNDTLAHKLTAEYRSNNEPLNPGWIQGFNAGIRRAKAIVAQHEPSEMLVVGEAELLRVITKAIEDFDSDVSDDLDPCNLQEAIALRLRPYLREPKRESVDLSPIREALEAAPVHVTRDGVWINFRPDANKEQGGAMIKVEGKEAEAIIGFSKKIGSALAALSKIEDGSANG